MARESTGWCCGGFGWGVFFVLIGALWLARDLGWIPDFPIFPVILISLGLGMLLNSLKNA